MEFAPRFIPIIPAVRKRGNALAPNAWELVLCNDDRLGPTVQRVKEVLAMGSDMRVWPLEPIDGFPHFERDIAAFFEHRIWRREGMGFSSLELAGVVPITCMLSATERWLTGTFTTTRLPENLREAARDSNLTHVVGMLDILDTHYDKVFSLVGSTTSMRRLTHTIIWHDLLEFPWGDHGRIIETELPTSEVQRFAQRKREEEEAALKLILRRTLSGAYATTIENILRKYETGKPKHSTFETAHTGDLIAFLVKLIDHTQGTAHGHLRIFPSYRHGVLATRDTAAPDPHKQSRIDAHIEDSIAELESIALKILRLVESQSKEDFALAVDVVNAITGELPWYSWEFSELYASLKNSSTFAAE